jgi:hypothetical protein
MPHGLDQLKEQSENAPLTSFLRTRCAWASGYYGFARRITKLHCLSDIPFATSRRFQPARVNRGEFARVEFLLPGGTSLGCRAKLRSLATPPMPFSPRTLYKVVPSKMTKVALYKFLLPRDTGRDSGRGFGTLLTSWTNSGQQAVRFHFRDPPDFNLGDH